MDTTMKTYAFPFLIIAVGVAMAFGSSKVFGGGGGADSGGCGNCNGTVQTTGSCGGGCNYSDTNGNGRPDPGEPRNGPNGGGGGFVPNGGLPPPPPPPPLPCTLTLDKSVIVLGTSTVALSWTPQPRGAVVLRRASTRLTVPSGVSAFSDVFGATRVGKYTYTLSYSASTTPNANGRTTIRRYACSAPIDVVTKITECNDNKDNGDSEDALIDEQDPGCHTDGNSGNPATYNSSDTTEGNVSADLLPTVQTVTRSTARRPISVTASAKNQGGTYATTNALVFGWRDTSGTAPAPRCGNRGQLCFIENGHTFRRFAPFNRTYAVGQTQTAPVRAFNPPVKGMYEVCAIADYNNVIPEGVSGEANNNTCRIIDVVDAVVTTATTTITGPLVLIATPTRIKRGGAATLTWDTGGRIGCSIAGTNGDTIDLTGAASASSQVTPSITSETIYTLACTDDASRSDTTIKLIPQYQEF